MVNHLFHTDRLICPTSRWDRGLLFSEKDAGVDRENRLDSNLLAGWALLNDADIESDGNIYHCL